MTDRTLRHSLARVPERLRAYLPACAREVRTDTTELAAKARARAVLAFRRRLRCVPRAGISLFRTRRRPRRLTYRTITFLTMVSPDQYTHPGDDSAPVSRTAHPRSGSHASSHQGTYVSSGISTSRESFPAPSVNRSPFELSAASAMPTALATPSCLREGMTPMTLMELLLRGMNAGDGAIQSPDSPAGAGGARWSFLLPLETPHLDAAAASSGRGQSSRSVQQNRRMRQALAEAIQVIASDIPAEGASTSRRVEAPQ
jgi:hypothetical protein